MIIYKTSHDCHKNSVRSERYWLANETNSKLIHIGICDVDLSFMKMLLAALEVKFVELDMSDDSFKKLMLSEGYEQ